MEDVLDDYAYTMISERLTELEDEERGYTRLFDKLEAEGRLNYAHATVGHRREATSKQIVSLRRSLRLISRAVS